MSSIGTTPSGRFSPKPHRKRIVKVSIAMCIARSPCTVSPMRWQPISARAATAAERGGGIRVAPQQRQRRGDQSGAHHREQRDHALDRVGKLDRHHGVGRQAEAAQPRRECRDRAVGLRVGEAAHRPVGERRPVGRIDQRERIRPALRARGGTDRRASPSRRAARSRRRAAVDPPRYPPGSRRPHCVCG